MIAENASQDSKLSIPIYNTDDRNIITTIKLESYIEPTVPPPPSPPLPRNDLNEFETTYFESYESTKENEFKYNDKNAKNKIKGYVCNKCGKEFTHYSNLSIHKRIHLSDPYFKCDVCDKQFIRSGDKTKHMRVHSGERPYECYICGRRFTQNSNMRKHLKIMHGATDENISNELIRRKNEKYSQLKNIPLFKHSTIDHRDNTANESLNCRNEINGGGMISKDQKNSEDMHMNSFNSIKDESYVQHDNTYFYHLTNCNENSKNLQSIDRRHGVSTSADKRFSPPSKQSKTLNNVVDKIVNNQNYSVVNYTEQINNEEDNIVVIVEPQEEIGEETLKRTGHKFFETSERSGNESSSLTNRTVYNDTLIHGSNSVKSVESDKCYNCSVCGRQFQCGVDLKKHIRVHSGGKPYLCDICGKGFSQICNMKKHYKMHGGRYKSPQFFERKLFNSKRLSSTCESNTFSQPDVDNDKDSSCITKTSAVETDNDYITDANKRNNENNVDEKICQTEKPFKCNICERLFLRNADLIKHTRVHSGEKPFQCPECGKRFSQNSNVRKHCKIMHGLVNIFIRKQYFYEFHSSEMTSPIPVLDIKNNSKESAEYLESSNVSFKNFKDNNNEPNELSNDVCIENKEPTEQNNSPINSESIAYQTSPQELKQSNEHDDGEILKQNSFSCISGPNNDKNYKCDLCGKICSSSSDIKKHMRVHSGEKPFECMECGRRFSQNSNVRKHWKIMHGSISKLRILKHIDNLSNHVKLMNTSKRDMPFIDSDQINPKLLKEREHMLKDKVYSPTQMLYLSEYTTHETKECNISHFSEENLSMEKFGTNNGLHMTPYKHNVDDPTNNKSNASSCSILSPVDNHYLPDFQTQHEPTSTESPVVTSVNGIPHFSAFKVSNDTFQRHINVERNGVNKLFKCNLCSKEFLRGGDIKKHMRVHSGERPYICKICGKRFTQSSNMRKHCRMMHRKWDRYKFHDYDHSYHVENSVTSNRDDNLMLMKRIDNSDYRLTYEQKNDVERIFDIKTSQDTVIVEQSDIVEPIKSVETLIAKPESTEHDKVEEPTKLKNSFKAEKSSESNILVVEPSSNIPAILFDNQTGYSRSDHINIKNNECNSLSDDLMKPKESQNNGERFFTCKICGKSFLRVGDFKKHMRVHSGEKPYFCTICSKRFSQSSNMIKHRKMHGTWNRYKNSKFLNQQTYFVDKNLTYTTSQYSNKDSMTRTVKGCLDSSDSKKVIEEKKNFHIVYDYENIDRSNNYGDHKIQDVKKNNQILTVHNKNDKYEDGSIQNYCKIDRRSNQNSGANTIISHVSRAHTMNSHVSRGNTINSHESRANTMNSHVSRENTINSHVSRDYIIKSQVSEANTINSHVNRAHTVNNHVSNQNSGTNTIDSHVSHFTNNTVQDSSEHVPIRSSFINEDGVKCFTCNICGKNFVRSGDLAKHIRVHSGEKPYKCQLCGRCFSQNSNMRKHMKIMHGEKNNVDKHFPLYAGSLYNHNSIITNYPSSTTGSHMRTSPETETMLSEPIHQDFADKELDKLKGTKEADQHVFSTPDPSHVPCEKLPSYAYQHESYSKGDILPECESLSMVCKPRSNDHIPNSSLSPNSHFSNTTMEFDDLGSHNNKDGEYNKITNSLIVSIKQEESSENVHVVFGRDASSYNITSSIDSKHNGYSEKGHQINESFHGITESDDQSDCSMLKCEVCGKEFKRNADKVKHMRVHNGERPYACPVCGKRFTQNSNMYKHLRMHEVRSNKSNNVINEYESHSNICQDNPMSVALVETPSDSSVSTKSEQNALTTSFNEPLQNRIFSLSNNEIKKDLSTMKDDYDLYVSNIDKEDVLTFPTKNDKDSIDKASFIEQLKCDICNKEFSCSSNFKIHMRVHSGEKPYSCPDCGQRFSQSGNMHKHRRKHANRNPFDYVPHTDNIENQNTSPMNPIIPSMITSEQKNWPKSVFSTEIVSHSLENRSSQENHQPDFINPSINLNIQSPEQGEHLIHHQNSPEKLFYNEKHSSNKLDDFLDRPNIQSINESSSNIASSVTPIQYRHLEVVDNGTSVNRSIRDCTKQVDYSDRLNLQTTQSFPSMVIPFTSLRHHKQKSDAEINTHENHNSNIELANETNSYPGDMTTNLDGNGINNGSISNHESLSCHYCGKQFIRSGDLKKHLRVHSGEKPYVCDICGKAFSQSSNMRKHRKLIHPSVNEGNLMIRYQQ